jgi:hypothetical protein
MADDKNKELSALERANEIERDIILNGPKDPDNFKMPDGRTLSETRRELYDSQIEEGIADDKVQQQRIREQSTEGDPLYHPAAQLAETAHGTVNVLPAPAAESEDEGDTPEAPEKDTKGDLAGPGKFVPPPAPPAAFKAPEKAQTEPTASATPQAGEAEASK